MALGAAEKVARPLFGRGVTWWSRFSAAVTIRPLHCLVGGFILLVLFQGLYRFFLQDHHRFLYDVEQMNVYSESDFPTRNVAPLL